MRSVLYYPYIQIRNIELIKHSLLLWDNINYIVPHNGYKIMYNNQYTQKAIDIIGKPIIPNSQEKKEAHDKIVKLANLNLPDYFMINKSGQTLKYDVGSEKFLFETWHDLRNSKLAEKSIINPNDYTVSNALGFCMMSILADVCAGSQLQRITDQNESYEKLDKYLEISSGLEEECELSLDKVDDIMNRLTGITIKIIDSSKINIKNLTKFRENENTQTRMLRHKYVDKIQEKVNYILTSAKTKRDIDEIERQFEQDMKDDLSNLKDELKINSKQTFFSKEIVFTVGGLVNILFTKQMPENLSILTIPSLYNVLSKFNFNRKEILKKHNMSWLFSLSSSKLTIY